MEGPKRGPFLTLVGVSLVPVACLLALALYQLSRTVAIRDDAVAARESTENFRKYDELIQALQWERGRTAAYIRARGDDSIVGGSPTLPEQRRLIDGLLAGVEWPSPERFPDHLRTKDRAKQHLHNYRASYLNYTVPENIRFFNAMISHIISATQNLIVLPERGDLWRQVAAAGQLLRATEPIHSAASMMRTFAWFCEISEENYMWMLELKGAGDALLNNAISWYTPLRENVTRLYYSDLKARVDADRTVIKKANFTDICLSISQEERQKFSFGWFANAFSYFGLLKELRNDAIINLIMDLESISSDAEAEMLKYAIVVAVIVVVCAAIIARQAWVSYKSFTKLSKLERSIEKNEHRIEEEKRRGELLLYQMVPESVVAKMNQGVETTQDFSNVTIAYIDIVGFVSLISKLKPVEVATLLKNLYTLFDSAVDKHNIHKMEQNNDVYCVVGGLPEPNSTHAREVAQFVLHIMGLIKVFTMDGLPGVRLQARAGIHSGPCAAGVLQTKGQRYSIFGESVKMASRMSRTAEVQQIRISKATRNELVKSGENYQIEDMGMVKLYGIGEVKTYTLHGVGETKILTSETKSPRVVSTSF